MTHHCLCSMDKRGGGATENNTDGLPRECSGCETKKNDSYPGKDSEIVYLDRDVNHPSGL